MDKDEMMDDEDVEYVDGVLRVGDQSITIPASARAKVCASMILWTDIASLRDLVHRLGDNFDDVIYLLKWAKSGCCGNGVPNPFTASSAPSDGDVHIRTIAR